MCEDDRGGAALSGGSAEGKAPYGDSRGTSAVPPRELHPDRSGTALWPVWDTTLHLVVTSPDRLVDARRLVIDQVAAIDDACNPFRSDSEVRALQQAHGQPVRVSALLAELVAVSLRAAQLTDGDVDPIAGVVMRGRDRELSRTPSYVGGTDVRTPSAPDWRSIRRDGREITVPAGALLDLSAMAQARAVDSCAWLIYKRFKVGVLVGIGGDIATAGQPPAGGWESLIRANPGGPGVPVHLPSTALATSKAVSRRWRGGGRPLTYALCPGTSRSAAPVWRSVSVAAFRCTHAKTLSMAALVRGHAAPDWLRDLGVSARLVAADGEVVTVGRWPADETR
ncbi:MAG: ApbE family lipoprotein [Dactylosporangium sp.]|nr:ApbE family lipoprotein [Dactylosporangium sp.]